MTDTYPALRALEPNWLDTILLRYANRPFGQAEGIECRDAILAALAAAEAALDCPFDCETCAVMSLDQSETDDYERDAAAETAPLDAPALRESVIEAINIGLLHDDKTGVIADAVLAALARRPAEAAPPIDLTNHHNAAKCPYCAAEAAPHRDVHAPSCAGFDALEGPCAVTGWSAEAAPLDAWNERNAPDREADAFRAGLAAGRAETAPLDVALGPGKCPVCSHTIDFCKVDTCGCSVVLALAATSRKDERAQGN